MLLLPPGLGMLAVWQAHQRPVPRPVPTAASIVDAQYRSGIDSLTAAIAELAALPRRSPAGTMQAAFRRARRAYKRVEYLVADRLPEAELAVNGPPLPRPHESMADVVLPPAGLQVIEGVLFPSTSPTADSVIAAQVRLLAPALAALRRVRTSGQSDSRFFDAVRQEIARVSTLGIAGFDATVSGDAIGESAEALRGVRAGLAAYRPPAPHPSWRAWDELDRRLGNAVAALEAEPMFDRFDRLAFIAGSARPAAEALTRFQQALGIPRAGRPGAWPMAANTIFDPGALDPFDYAPSDAPALRPELVALGRMLFFDPRLSRSERRACATCHQPARGFADGRTRARVDPGPGRARNTPTLLNAAVQPFQFADARARSLEDQVAAVMANPREMNLPLDSAAAKLRADHALVTRFAAVYGVAASHAITPRRLQTSLAAFVRSLVAVDSRFDRAVRGDTAALSPEARLGFTVFMGKGACATCHFLPTFGGSMPPGLLESEPEVIGVPSNAVRAGARVDPDPGVAGFDHARIHRHAFKTPSLRNVALTAPYMHNGVYRTLDQVVEFYDRGGGAGIGIALANQTLAPEQLHLTGAERRALIAFMGALTDSSVVVGAKPR
ncbi:MAG: cytochrome c peroxidase [Gemmatimonadales bacterium]